jgi:hypothetical protein
VAIKFPNVYPFKPPAVRFETPIWHPWISCTGQPCLRMLDDDVWSPSLDIRQLLAAVLDLLTPAYFDAPPKGPGRIIDIWRRPNWNGHKWPPTWAGPCAECQRPGRTMSYLHESNVVFTRQLL